MKGFIMVNKVFLVGRLGRDPDVRSTQNGKAVANFSIATSEKYTKDGKSEEKTEWHNVVCWDKLAEIAQKYLKKGSLIYLEGKLQSKQYDDKDGKKVTKTEVLANVITFIDTKTSEKTQQNTLMQAQEFDDIPF